MPSEGERVRMMAQGSASPIPTGAEAALAQAIGMAMLGDGGMKHVVALCDMVGKRPAGSAAERRAVEYLRRALEELGFPNVRAEPFAAVHWQRGATSARLVSPVEREIELLALPGTLSHSGEAPVVWAPYQTREEFLAHASDLAGSVVVNTSVPRVGQSGSGGVLHRSERNRLCHELGGAAFLWVSQRPGQLLPTGSVAREIGEAMPSFGISLEDARFIERLVNDRHVVRLEYSTQNTVVDGTSWNVVATHGPETGPEVVLSAHHDSHDITVGAFDNAAGCAAVLEAARALIALGPNLPCRLRVAIFGAEEAGLQGSRAYADQHSAELGDMRFLFNLDGLGAIPSWKYVHVPLRSDVADYIDSVYRRLGFFVEVEEALALNWDHAPFALRGVPVASLTAKWPTGTLLHYGHTSADTPEKLDTQDLRYVAACTVALVSQVLFDYDWGFGRLNEDEVARRLKGVDRA